MVLRLLLVLMSTALLSSCCNNSYGRMGGGCASQYGCSSAGFPSCQCADPSCTGNACLSASRCCSVYGNIGSRYEESNVSENWDSTYSLASSSYNDNYSYVQTTPYHHAYYK